MDKISIIVPVYNVEKYIKKCIESIKTQTYTNFEALIINDGSPDNSIEIAKKIAGNDQRFIFFNKKNGGLSSARNFGIDQAKGKFIAFLDSDDYISPNFLSGMYSAITQTNADIAICDINLVSVEGNILSTTYNKVNDYYTKKDYFLCTDTITSYAWDKLYRATVFNNLRYDESVKTYEDSHFTFRAIYNRKITSTNTFLYNYVQRPEAITKSLPPTLLQDKVSVLQEYDLFSFLHPNIEITPEYKNFCYLKTLVLGPSVIIAKYSKNYKKDISELMRVIDPDNFTIKKIAQTRKLSLKISLSLIVLKISKLFFKYLVIVNNKGV